MTEKIIQNFKKSLVYRYTKNLFQLMPKKLVLALSLMVLISLIQGISLILLVPLLQLVGLSMGQGFFRSNCKFNFSYFHYIRITSKFTKHFGYICASNQF